MLPPDNDLTAIDSYPSFYFRMTYKFLKHSDAVVRYGSPINKKYTGIRDRTTVCNVHFHSCDSSPCYVQSPNYPGLYPRNTTCYYQLKQPAARPGTRAVLVLEQTSGFLIHIKSASQPHDIEQRQLRLYEDCYYVGDYVRVYDGSSTTSPVLITFCRGDALPEIISSGPNMLIEFTTSAFDEPDHEVPWTYLNGFELVAQARFLPMNEIGPSCSMQINGRKSKSGWLTTPSFSLAPNSTCVWEFKGPPNHVVWLTFAHYWIEKQDKLLHMTLCAAELTIFDGLLGIGDPIGSYCHHKLPRVCDRAHRLKNGAASRPCGVNESYVTSGPTGAISQSYGESTVVKNVKFLLRYEFVDIKLPGDKLADPCDRIIRSDGEGDIFQIGAPKSVFLYGRGGQKNMWCSWVLTGLPQEGVMVNITSITLGNSKCRSTILPYTQASGCQANGDPYMSLSVSEWPWERVEVPRSCVCTSDSVPLIIESRSSTLAINLTIMGMDSNQDHQNFSFVAFYQFIERSECAGGERRIDAPAGELLLGDHESAECSGRPWLLTAPIGHSLLLTLPRAVLANESCASDSRLLLRNPSEENPSLAICPSADPSSTVKLLWPLNVDNGPTQTNDRTRPKSRNRSPGTASLIVQWESHSISTLKMQWLRLWSPFNESDMNDIGTGRQGEYDGSKMSLTTHCKEWCPELNACIPAELWCDGTSHCPNGKYKI
ncbi:UNVERIFIED_CONTAM: hypothetical protein GTU68_066259 [Idotea baltica]|nr:hypothetical protein [Idotea baltica]